MKKTVVVLALMLVMASSLAASTLAMYTTSIDDLADGSVVAKEFIFLGEGTDSFSHGIKIAPKETVDWQFSVKNYDGSLVTETDLYYKLTFNVQAMAGKTAIQPLVVSVLDSDGTVLNSVTGTGTFDVTGAFPMSPSGQSEGYTVKIYWPSDDSTDIDYAGGSFGTTVNVDAAASQVPFGDSEEQISGLSVLYQTSPSWTNGQSSRYEYEYKVTITNNSDQSIEDWFIEFNLGGDKLTRAWSNAVMVQGKPDGSYRFVNPAYNNPSTDDILPGQSVTFRGPAVGQGTQPISNVVVGGSNVNASAAQSGSAFGVTLN